MEICIQQNSQDQHHTGYCMQTAQAAQTAECNPEHKGKRSAGLSNILTHRQRS